MAKRDEYLANIRRKLSAFMVEVGMNNQVNRQNINISGEDVSCGLLNLLFDWELINTNGLDQNFPAIDLVDWEEAVAVQVTSDTTSTKIKKTLAKVCTYNLAGKLKKVIVLLLKEKPDYTTEFPHDGFELEILDLYDISKLVERLPVKKLGQISEYLDEELGSLFDAAPKAVPKHLLPAVPAPSASFVPGSRDKELEELKEKLSPDAPVFLWGVGGIGKTEVAIQLAKRFTPPEGAYFLHYYDMPGEGDALRETILRADFTDYRYQGADTDNRDHEYKERMDILRTEYPGALLVIDNFDRTGKTMAELMADPAYNELTAMGIRLVFTTRSRVKGGYEIKPLDEQFLLTLMRDNLDGMEVSDDDLRQLIQAVEGHTLMVVLMARTLARSYGNLKPADIRTALKESRLNSTSFHKVENQHNPQNVQARIYDHMKALFVLSDMNKLEKDILRWATLLPEDGMDAGLFQACLKNSRLDNIPEEIMEQIMHAVQEKFGDEVESEEELRQFLGKAISKMQEDGDNRQDTLGFLIDRGWLAKGEKNLLTIHPVIREVCREELEPTDENCGDFLDRLRNRYNMDREFYADQFTQIAKCFSMASDKLDDKDGSFALRAGRFWNKLGQAQTALRYNLRMVARRENHPDVDSNDLATAYNNVGESYRSLGDYQKTLEYHQKALAICEKVLPADHPDLATSYNNVGVTYSALGNRQKALEYKLKALAIREKVLPPDQPDLAQSYSNVGVTYGALGDHQKALEYDLKALAIREKVLPADHPDLATSYNNVGVTYSALGNRQKALEYKLKALAIYEKVLPPDHPDLAASYNNVGSTYYALDDHQKALEYLLKALAIYEKVLPPEHPDLATSYNNVGVTYSALGDHQKELEYNLKAMAIREQVLPQDHPSLAQSYNNIGITYANLEQFSKALEYLEKALAIRKKSLPADHPYIASTERNIEAVRTWL